jgi:PAS domain S-box-containing protein
VSEARLRLAQEAAGIGFWECDIASQALSWSPEQYCLHGLVPPDAPSTFGQWLGLAEPEDRLVAMAAGEASQLSGAIPLHMEFRFKRASDGAIRWLASLGRVIVDDAGRPRLIGVTLDVTGQRQAEEDLRLANAKLHALRNLPQAAVAVKQAGRHFSKAGVMSGYTRHEVFGRGRADRTRDLGQAAPAEADARRPAGAGHAKEGGFGKEAHWPNIAAGTAPPDIKRLNGGDASRNSGGRLRPAAGRAVFGMANVDLDGNWTLVDGRFCKLLGYTRRELLAKTFVETTHPDDIAGNLEVIRHLLTGDSAVLGMATRYLQKDGSQIQATLTVSLTRHRDGTPRHFTMMVEDVSDPVSAEASLLGSERGFFQIFEHVPLPSYLIDPFTASIVDCNDAAAAMLGYERNVLRSMRVADIDAAMGGDGADTVSRQPMLAGQPVQSETRHRTRSGEVRDVIVAAVSIDIGGRPLAHWLVVDITEHKRTEAELRRLAGDLEIRMRAEAAARETAQSRVSRIEHLAALAQIAGGIAHEFNNLLQAVQGSAAMIARHPEKTENVRRYARIVAEAASQGASITARLLAFAHRGDLCAEAVDAATIIEGIHDALAITLGPAITLQVETEAALPLLLADKAQLELALVALAANAGDAMPHGGILTLSAAIETAAMNQMHWAGISPGSYVRIVVGNANDLNANGTTHGFEPFFTTKPLGQGVGLGLALVKVFAEQSGGGMAIDTAQEHATRVAIWLPLARNVPEPYQTVAAQQRQTLAGGTPVLVVDDDPLVLETVAAQLEDEGFMVTTATNGIQALGLLDEGLPVRALVSDLSMPGMDGVSLIREAQTRRPSLPAVLLTGYAEEPVLMALGNRIKGRFALARKPVRGSELAARLNAITAEAETGGDSTG